MQSPHFDVAIAAFTKALQGRINPDISSFPDLFVEDAVIDVPFDGQGDGTPIRGRAAIELMTRSLEGFLWFEEVTFHQVRETSDPDVVVCEYEAILRRADRQGLLRRRYISIITISQNRIAHLREYGGPFIPIA